MNEEHGILEQVYAAKESVQAADQLIGDYLPFIRAETAKFLKRPPEEGRDDELSIAMIARQAQGLFFKVCLHAHPQPPD